ncbi:MAG: hypothetical protein IKU07_05865 [Oscillospiraceae bacterium]|nr:hypothetical protein [Oscillospiraceae bacterium]
MKKLLAFLLAAVLVLGLFGCGGAEEAKKPEGLLTGFGKVDITPAGTVHLQGGDWANRRSNGLLDLLFVTCVAIQEGDTTVLLYTMDFKVATDNFVDPAKAAVSAATGVPQEYILFNATHTHSATALRYKWDGVENHKNNFTAAAVNAATAAIADLSPTEIYAGSTQTENMTFVRHYVDATGQVVLRTDPALKAHYREADGEMQLVKFARSAEDKKDILLMSFPSHATFNEGGLEISADYPSPTRDYVEANSDCLVAFFQGASGNQTPDSRVPGMAKNSSDYRTYGQKLGQYAVDALPTLTKVEGQSIKLNSRNFTAGTNKKNTDKLVAAKDVVAISQQFGRNSAEEKAALEKYGFAMYLEASWTITRANLDPTMTMELKTFSVGDLSFVIAPYEMFGHNGTDIKTQSVFDNTFLITCSEGAFNYIASTDAFDFNSYESYCCYFEQGTAEKLVTEYLDMLAELKQ